MRSFSGYSPPSGTRTDRNHQAPTTHQSYRFRAADGDTPRHGMPESPAVAGIVSLLRRGPSRSPVCDRDGPAARNWPSTAAGPTVVAASPVCRIGRAATARSCRSRGAGRALVAVTTPRSRSPPHGSSVRGSVTAGCTRRHGCGQGYTDCRRTDHGPAYTSSGSEPGARRVRSVWSVRRWPR